MPVELLRLVAALAAALVFLLAAFIVSRYYGIKKLTYRRYFSPDGVFEGERAFFIEEVENRFFLPLFFVDIEAFFFNELALDEYADSGYSLQHFISRHFLPPFTKVKRSIGIRCVRRGYYELATVNVSFFGINLYLDSKAGIHVYPRALPSGASNPLEYEMQHSAQAVKRMLRDPFNRVGVRDYLPGDPFGRINFKTTARTGRLKVNEFDFFSSRNFMVYIDFHTPSAIESPPSEAYERMMERALSYAAEMAMLSMRHGYSAGFAANCRRHDGANHVRFPMGRGQDHCEGLLRAMSEVRMQAGASFGWLLKQDLDAVWNAEVYVLAIRANRSVFEILSVYGGMGNHVTVIELEEDSDHAA
ncbi:MAG: DUF58 domain-containing protein [Defluviitaleaceae bacterium]|nr:DUF58 domain-containing protein [Defluviitaleaceae bacterium]